MKYKELIKDRIYLKVSKNKNSFKFLIKNIDISIAITEQLREFVKNTCWGRTNINSDYYFYSGQITNHKEFENYIQFLKQIKL